MLTKMFSAMPSASRLLMGGVAALALLGAPATFDRAYAGGVETFNCVGYYGSVSCVRRWDWGAEPRERPLTEQEEAESAERHRKWVARCRPVIRQDQFGVGRYYYAAPGCEFGKFQD
jgi:hypothetical protein